MSAQCSMEHMRKDGLVVFLDVPKGDIVERMARMKVSI